MSEFLCKIAELSEAEPKLVRVQGQRIVVVRVGASVYALQASCPHYAGPLNEGSICADRLEITCPWHRFRFSLRDGSCVAATKRPAAQTFAVVVNGDDVFAEIPVKETEDR